MRVQREKTISPDTKNSTAENTGNPDVRSNSQPEKVAVQGELFDLPKSRKPWMRPYNGWTWKERCAVTPIQNKALREGRLQRPTVCSICLDSRSEYPKGRDYRFLHTEDYSRPLNILPCCKPCHAALHARFDDPARWLEVVKENWRKGAWFTLLSMDPASQYQSFSVTYPNGL